MAVVTLDDKVSREKAERNNAWEKLRKLPEYISDYNAQLDQDTCIKRWSFYPLDNPVDENPSLEFLTFFFSYREDVIYHNSPIDWNGFDHYYVENEYLYDPNENGVISLSEFAPTIEAKIDLRYPVSTLVEEFKKSIIAFQDMLELKISNTKTHDHLEYLASCLLKIGLSNNEIIEKLLSDEIRKLSYDNPQKEAKKQQIRRILKSLTQDYSTKK